jgi:SAM-dependent methyltransferase
MKPKHLAKEYGDQFQDEGIVQRYHHRPDYPDALFERIAQRLPTGANVLDIGCGTGELAIPLANIGFQVEGIDPSMAMIERAKAASAKVNWCHCYTEEFNFHKTYDLIVAANSLHWMNWSVVFPMFKQALAEKGTLAIVTGGDLFDYSGAEQVLELIKAYSTNQDFKPFSLVELLQHGNFIKAVEAVPIPSVRFSQSIDSFIESIHARNGFSVERMGEQVAQEFDTQLKQCLSAHGDVVAGKVKAELSFVEIV